MVLSKDNSLFFSEINSCLENIKLPSEFNRQPRTLDELSFWKATELRSFLLYTGMVAVKKVFIPAQYKHYLSLCLSMRMLFESVHDVRHEYLESARKL